jgi:hypothetical protein
MLFIRITNDLPSKFQLQLRRRIVNENMETEKIEKFCTIY